MIQREELERRIGDRIEFSIKGEIVGIYAGNYKVLPDGLYPSEFNYVWLSTDKKVKKLPKLRKRKFQDWSGDKSAKIAGFPIEN